MEIKIVKISGGFANVASSYVLAENYYGKPISARAGSAYDEEIAISVPENSEVIKIDGEYHLFIGDVLYGEIFKEADDKFVLHAYGHDDILVKRVVIK